MFRAETRCLASKLKKGGLMFRAETRCLASKLNKVVVSAQSRNYDPLALSSRTCLSIYYGVARKKARTLSRYSHGGLV